MTRRPLSVGKTQGHENLVYRVIATVVHLLVIGSCSGSLLIHRAMIDKVGQHFQPEGSR